MHESMVLNGRLVQEANLAHGKTYVSKRPSERCTTTSIEIPHRRSAEIRVTVLGLTSPCKIFDMQ